MFSGKSNVLREGNTVERPYPLPVSEDAPSTWTAHSPHHNVTINTYLDWERNDEWSWYASMNQFFKAVIVRDEWAVYNGSKLINSGTFAPGTSSNEKFHHVQGVFTKMIRRIN